MSHMCGRFVQTQNPETYATYFSFDFVRSDPLPPSWNVAPTYQVYAVAVHFLYLLLVPFFFVLVPLLSLARMLAAYLITSFVYPFPVNPAFLDSLL